MGAEYRRETSDFVPDPIIQQSLTWVEGEQPKKGKFDVKEVFLELNAPVLEDRPMAKLLSFGGAVRLSDYETVGEDDHVEGRRAQALHPVRVTARHVFAGGARAEHRRAVQPAELPQQFHRRPLRRRS